MITKAIIEEILDDGYHARVRIPVYNKDKNAPAATPFEELYIASINCEPGSSPALKVGDVVFVGFENNLVKSPIILGLLFRRDIDTVSDLHVSSLIADINVNLPKDTTIGEVQPKDLANLAGTKGSIQGQINLLEEKIKQSSGGISLFYATYGVTTYDEVITKINEGYLPVCKYNDRIYICQNSSGTLYFKSIVQQTKVYDLALNSSNTWSTGAITMLSSSNLISSTSSATSSDSTIYTSKAIDNKLGTKVNYNFDSATGTLNITTI